MNSEMEQNNLEPTGEFAASIRDFRSAVTHVAGRETSRPVAANWLAPARKRRRSAQAMALAWGCAALVCLATLPFFSHSHQAAIHLAAPAIASAPAADSDTALLEQVDTDVSESVPPPLAPLADLDSLDTSSSDTLSSSSVHGKSLPQTESTNATQ
jgi:hypothetical protein